MLWFLLIVIAIIAVVAVVKSGVFNPPAQCQCCGVSLKGTEQTLLGSEKVVLCKNCAEKIHPQILGYAKKNWSYSDYTDYLAWEEETRQEREQFNPDVEYGNLCALKIDTKRGLFSLDLGFKKSMVFRFADLVDFDLNFKPEKVKEGLLGDKVKGNEFAAVELSRPRVYLEEIIKYGVSLGLRKKGILSSKYEYELSDAFLEAIRTFTICACVEASKDNDAYQQGSRDIGKIEKALALFMFDSMDEVTPDSLKQQRNALIKAFHPDNNESNETFSQKINAAYALLSSQLRVSF